MTAPVVVCVGTLVQDYVFWVDRFPGINEKVDARAFELVNGGNAGNAALAAARLGARVRLASAAGADAVGDNLVHGLAEAGVDTGFVQRRPGKATSASSILIDPSGERQIATRREDGIDQALPDGEVARLVDGATAVLADIRYRFMTPQVLAAARARGLLAMIDGDRAIAPNDPVLRDSTHAVFSAEAIRETTGERELGAAVRALAAMTPALAAVTDGEHGVYWWEDGAVQHLPAYQVPVIDTLGAGDVFHAAAVVALAEGADLRTAFRFGAAAAALKCMNGHGGSGAPMRAEVEAFLRERAG